MKFKGYLKSGRLLSFEAAVVLIARTITAKSAPHDVNLVTAIEDVAKKAIPSVVHIEATWKQTVTNPLLPFQDGPFSHYFSGNQKMPEKFEREMTWLGKGPHEHLI